MSAYVDGQYEAERVALMSQREQATPGKLDRIIDILRTGAWFEFARHSLQNRGLGAFHAAYSVGKYLQPGTYGSDPATDCDNRWAKYAQGVHVPSRSTLEEVEAKVPGATEIIDARRWSLLNTSRPAKADESALAALAPHVFDCLFVPGSGRQGGFGCRRSLKPALRLLTGRVSTVDALMASVWLLREAAEQGPSEQCLKIGAAVHRILLMSLCFTPLHSIRYSLLTYFHRYVFPLAASTDVVIHTPVEELINTLVDFGHYILILEDCGVLEGYKPDDSSQWRRMLDGTLGLDLMYGLGPRYQLRPGCQNPEAHVQVARERILKEWALSVIAVSGYQPLPPANVVSRALAVTG